MAFGKPAIGYNIEGLKELIKNNKTGYIIKKYVKTIWQIAYLNY